MLSRRVGVAVMGAGLQGAAVALELARRNIPVTLIEQDQRPVNRASLRNEGKIHLGFIYANDPTLATARLQMEGALNFRRLLTRWIDRQEDWLVRSTPFYYLVATDSLLSVDKLTEHYDSVDRLIRERLGQDCRLDYLGVRPDRIFRRLESAEIETWFEPVRIAAGFATCELAIDTDTLALALRRALAGSPNLTVLTSHTARAISEKEDGYLVEGDGPEGSWSVRAAQVVNATWERRLKFDAQLGILAPPQLLHRLKFRVIARCDERLCGAPSVSMVLGRYGDVVIRHDRTAYLSWYPAGLRGWSHDLEPPLEWDRTCRGEVDPECARQVAAEVREGIAAWYRGIADAQTLQVDAGAIVALGRSDVDDAGSGLHNRSQIGVTSRGGYHSVDPGKLTTAPVFAMEAADRVEARLR